MKTRPEGLQYRSQHFDRRRESDIYSMEPHHFNHRFARPRFAANGSVRFRQRADNANGAA